MQLSLAAAYSSSPFTFHLLLSLLHLEVMALFYTLTDLWGDGGKGRGCTVSLTETEQANEVSRTTVGKREKMQICWSKGNKEQSCTVDGWGQCGVTVLFHKGLVLLELVTCSAHTKHYC